MTLELRGRTSAIMFLVAYGPTKPNRDEGKKREFSTALDGAVKEVTSHELLFVPMDANARMGRRGGGRPRSNHCGVLGAYGRDTRKDNGERLLDFACNHDLTLVNTFYRTPKNGIHIPSTR